jgi:hypothetical protein
METKMNMENQFQKLVNKKFLFRLYLLQKLPMAFIAGIRVKQLDLNTGTTVIKYGWLTQNPFRSMYFACQSMAAEMSTGLLVLNHVYKSEPPVSMLIVKNSAEYHKKAVGTIIFHCKEGGLIREAINKTKETGEGQIIELRSTGTDEAGDIVAEFIFTWSLKVKSK